MIQQFYFSVYALENGNRDAQRSLHTKNPSTTVHNSQKVETMEMPIKRCADTQRVIETFNGMLFSLKRE